MNVDRFTRALEIARWLDADPKPPVVEVADRLERAEHDAFLWHCVQLQLTPAERERFEQMAQQLRAAGYKATPI